MLFDILWNEILWFLHLTYYRVIALISVIIVRIRMMLYVITYTSRVGISKGVRRYPNGNNIHRHQWNNRIIHQVYISLLIKILCYTTSWWSGFSADQDLVFISSCRSGSSDLKSAADQDPVLYSIMLSSSYCITSVNQNRVLYYADPVLLV